VAGLPGARGAPSRHSASVGERACQLRTFGIIKSVLGFRQFLLRGQDRVRGEWNLVTMAWNMKRMFALCPSA
jgi:Transposase DDE domain